MVHRSALFRIVHALSHSRSLADYVPYLEYTISVYTLTPSKRKKGKKYILDMDTPLHRPFLDKNVNAKLFTNVSNLPWAQAEDCCVLTFRPELPSFNNNNNILEKTKAILVETSILSKSSAGAKGESKTKVWPWNRITHQILTCPEVSSSCKSFCPRSFSGEGYLNIALHQVFFLDHFVYSVERDSHGHF